MTYPTVELASGRKCAATVWSEETKVEPSFAPLIRQNFNSDFHPPKGMRNSAVVLVEIQAQTDDAPGVLQKRVMAVTFGSAHSHFAALATQEGFGLSLLLNLADVGELERVKKNVLGKRGKSIDEQLNFSGGVHDFAQVLDVFSVSKVGARPARLGNRTAEGADHLRTRTSMDFESLVPLGDLLLEAFLSNQARYRDFEELDQLTPVRAPAEIETMNSGLHRELTTNPEVNVSFAKPPLEDGQRLVFRYWLGGRNELDVSDAWTAEHLLKLIQGACRLYSEFEAVRVAIQEFDKDAGKWVDVKQPKSLKTYVSFVSEVKAANLQHPRPYRDLISEGQYFTCPATIHSRLIDRMSSVHFQNSPLPAFDHALDIDGRKRLSEGAYNDRVSVGPRVCFDRTSLRLPIGGAVVEYCDIFEDGDMHCVKRGTDSDAIIKVCQQAVDASITMENYPEEWDAMAQKAGVNYPFHPSRDRDKFKFIISLIDDASKHSSSRLNIKSMLAIVRARAEITGRGYGFEVHFIDQVTV